METDGQSDESDQQKLADHGAGGQTSLAGLDSDVDQDDQDGGGDE